jgi:hypothetical protein
LLAGCIRPWRDRGVASHQPWPYRQAVFSRDWTPDDMQASDGVPTGTNGVVSIFDFV